MTRAGYNCIEISNDFVKLGKYTRGIESEPFLRSGRIVLIEGNWIADFIEQCEGFPNSAHDDKVDVLTYPIYEYLYEGENPYILT
jgi:predicted phage terminase large subunit-like protein